MIEVKVQYPKPDALGLSVEDVKLMERFEDILKQHAFSIFFPKSDFRWKIEAEPTPLEIILSTKDNIEILRGSLSFFKNMTNARFLERLEKCKGDVRWLIKNKREGRAKAI